MGGSNEEEEEEDEEEEEEEAAVSVEGPVCVKDLCVGLRRYVLM